jgi:transcription elongation factor Elf1
MRCPKCGQSDEVILETLLNNSGYRDGIYYCERCKIRFQTEICDCDESIDNDNWENIFQND